MKEMTVVYVEDDEEMRESIARLLRRRVGALHLATNGKEGLELVRRAEPALVLTDLEMPEMNGIEMIHRIREELSSSVPIIVITAYNDNDHFTEKANRYVFKPVNTEELFATMGELASR